MQRIRYKGKVYVRAEADEYLYHVTYLNRLPNISVSGLVPGSVANFGGGYEGHSQRKIFLTVDNGISFWMDRLGNIAENESDRPVQDGWNPVVLRVRTENLEDLHEDEVGSRDAREVAYYVEDSINPDELEFWDGSDWESVTLADPGLMVEEAYEEADKDYEDDEELVYLDAEFFLPRR